MKTKTLIFVPTYNERENAPRMCREIMALGLDADVLFTDDGSPDGTGKVLDELKKDFPRLFVKHREGKLGIGSAHLEAIEWAYDNGYERLVTLDCDFTHSPSDIPKILAMLDTADFSVGSRWIALNSLPGWNVFRRFMTSAGHWLTKGLLGIPHDASGAFRGYRLDRLDKSLFSLVQSKGYAFFVESMFVLLKNGVSISEVAIVLPARTYGSSKMTVGAALRTVRTVFELALESLAVPERFLIDKRNLTFEDGLEDPQNWDGYWRKSAGKSGVIYDLIAAFYRQTFIRRNLDKAIFREFPKGSELLHAGCGSGQVDMNLQRVMKITALDISKDALRIYSRNNPHAFNVIHGSILDLPFPDNSLDGYYSLGVVEHFTEQEIQQIFREALRVLKPGGKMVIFWPSKVAPSVLILGLWHWLLKNLLKSEAILHPAEISLLKSKNMAETMVKSGGFTPAGYYYGPADLFIQAIVVGVNKS